MNSPVETPARRCPEQSLLEEYAARQTGDAATGWPELEEHLASCEVCRTRLEEFLRESRLLTEWLALREDETAGDCVCLEDLGCFLDGTLHADERAAVESHLTHCAQCRRALAGLYREVDAILAAETAGTPLCAPVEAPVALEGRHDASGTRSPDGAFSMEEWLERQASKPSAAPRERKRRKPRQSRG